MKKICEQHNKIIVTLESKTGFSSIDDLIKNNNRLKTRKVGGKFS